MVAVCFERAGIIDQFDKRVSSIIESLENGRAMSKNIEVRIILASYGGSARDPIHMGVIRIDTAINHGDANTFTRPLRTLLSGLSPSCFAIGRACWRSGARS